MKYLQKLGKSLMLPVAVLPVAGILMGIGNWIGSIDSQFATVIATFLTKASGAVLDNLPVLFAVGIAFGMTKSQDAAAALSGLVAFLVVTTLLSPEAVAAFKGIELDAVDPAFGAIKNVFVAIISGLVAASCYDRFHETKLPTALAFFSGKRCTPIVTAMCMLVVSIILFFIWPVIFGILVSFGKSIVDLGPVGAGIYGFFNRLLIPTGLHHALNNVFWFDLAGINDIANYWNGTGTLGTTGMYQAGFFPIMMFGLPGAALAMYHTAKDNKKKIAASLLLASALSAFLTGVTEPLEFSFMFLAPVLYLVHAVLTGISLAVAAVFHWTSGFTFSAGLVDYVLGFKLPMASKPYMLILQGVVFFALYYLIFRVLIVKLNLKTPGREDDDVNEEELTLSLANNNFTEIAKVIMEGLGGKDNVTSIDNCITRLRLEVKDMSKVDDKKIKSAGVSGVMKPGKNSVQVIVGTQVQFVADEFKKIAR